MATKVSNTILLRVYILFGGFILFAAIILLRILMLQVSSAKWDAIDKEERVIFKKLTADRGNILAENGTVLATSLPFYKIALDPMLLDTTKFVSFDDSLRVLSYNMFNLIGREEAAKDTTLGIDSMFYYRRVREAMRKKDRHIYLSKHNLNYKEFEKAKNWPILNRKRKDGGAMTVEKLQNKRFYPYGDMARATLGNVAADTTGVRGIEFSYNQDLRGKDGYFLAQKIAGGSYVPLQDYSDSDSEDGLDVMTTLDVDIQDIAERALMNGVISNNAKAGTAIVMEVATGKIKAIANYPETYNYAIANLIEPGSTFKLVSALAALEEHGIEPADSVDTGDGTFKIGDKTIKDSYEHGKIPYESVFALSSNVGIAMVTMDIFKDKPQKFIDYIDKFGFTKPSNEQIKGEPKPNIPRPRAANWSGASLPSMSIGYSLQVTPLQMLSFYNAIANNGKYVRPYLVSQILNDSRIVQDFTPKPENKQIASFVNVKKVTSMMEAVMAYGTAKNVGKTAFRIAGKTGTARKIVNGVYMQKYLASFGGFFPAEKPVYTIYIMIDEPSAGDIYGADVAAPIFKEIAEKIYTMEQSVLGEMKKLTPEPITKPAPKIMRTETAKQIYENMGIETSQIPDTGEWVASQNGGHQISLKEYKANGRVPDVRGMSARDAVNLLEEMGVNVHVSGIGKVESQSLAPGYSIGKGARITLYLNR